MMRKLLTFLFVLWSLPAFTQTVDQGAPAASVDAWPVTVITLPAITFGSPQHVIVDSGSITIPAITFASAQPVAQSGIWTVQPGNTANTMPWLIGGDVDVLTLPALVAGTANIGDVDVLTLPNVAQATAANLNMRADSSGATGAAPPARADLIGGLASGTTGGFLTSPTICDSFANINVVTATTTLIITGVSGRHVRICSWNFFSAFANNNVAFISGTGATCGTGTTGMTGGTTAATGYNFLGYQGLAQGSGLGEINRTNATGDSVCVITSAAVQFSGRVSYAIY